MNADFSAFNGAATIAAWQNWFLRMSFSNTPVVLPWPLQIGLELATREAIDGSRVSSLFLAVRLVVLPHCITRQGSFVLLCQLAKGRE
jgi:hypothetical protein